MITRRKVELKKKLDWLHVIHMVEDYLGESPNNHSELATFMAKLNNKFYIKKRKTTMQYRPTMRTLTDSIGEVIIIKGRIGILKSVKGIKEGFVLEIDNIYNPATFQMEAQAKEICLLWRLLHPKQNKEIRGMLSDKEFEPFYAEEYLER